MESGSHLSNNMVLQRVNTDNQTDIITKTLGPDAKTRHVSIPSATCAPESRFGDTSDPPEIDAARQSYLGSSHDILDWPVSRLYWSCVKSERYACCISCVVQTLTRV